MTSTARVFLALVAALAFLCGAALATLLMEAPVAVAGSLAGLSAACIAAALAMLAGAGAPLKAVLDHAKALGKGKAPQKSPALAGLPGEMIAALDSLAQAHVAALAKSRERAEKAERESADAKSTIDTCREQLDKGEALAASMARTAHKAAPISADVFAAVEELTGQIDMVNGGVEVQRDRMTETATAMEEMNATVMEVARNASDAATSAARSRENAQVGAQGVGRAVESMRQIETRMNTLKETMGQLGAKADGIGQIIDVINEIADQTNLLALNAAIEAARAGDAGRGFAVVADEVRKLAEKTMSATQEVNLAITEIQHTAQNNIQAVESTAGFIAESTEAAHEAGRLMEEIVLFVQDTAAQVESIATASEEQSAASEEINLAVAEVTRVASETAEGMGLATNALMEISSLVEELDSMVHSLEDPEAMDAKAKSGQLVAWDDSLSVNVNAIDEQHKKLIALINELHAAMKDRKGNAILFDVVKRLKDYTVTHFQFEEKLFDKYGFPDTKAHKEIHKTFVDTVANFDADLRSGRATVSMDVLRFLKRWLIEHIKGTDKGYSKFLNKHGVR